MPWRSATLGWLATAAILTVGLPLFLRMPIWIDATLYDVAAREVLRGGVHYRDVFDTNPPGFVWAFCAVRLLFGTSMEAARAVDFAVVVGIVAILLRWARAGGATRGGAAWTAAAAAAFYLFLSEFSHTQRDVWMTLPAAAAAWYRVRRVLRAERHTDGWVFWTALLEGALWGLGAWIKPHVILIAVATWLVVQVRLAGSASGPWWAKPRRSLADLLGSLAGGLLIGGAGVAYLVASGTWPYMLDVFQNWTPSYFDSILSKAEFEIRLDVQLRYYPPWSVLLLVAAPLAILNLLDARLWAGRDRSQRGPVGWVLPSWLHDRRADADARFVRAVLSAVYLAWVVVTFTIQKHLHYTHIPETFLMLAVLASTRWMIVVPITLFHLLMIVWIANYERAPHPVDQDAFGRLLKQLNDKNLNRFYAYGVWNAPDRSHDRFQWWSGCFARRVPGELRNGLAYHSRDYAGGVDWVEFAEVEEFLRSQGVREGDATVIGWHDSPHVLYLEMHLHPPIRFMHLSTAEGMGPEANRHVQEETTAAAPHVRFAVSDLRRVSLFFPEDKKKGIDEPGPGPDLLPPVVPPRSRLVFPLNQPTVFRSLNGRGRYVVHAVVNPVGDVSVPAGFDPK